ncbi:TPA: hypothetical protein N0F65_011650 [Lagenidium giganteum]|uniref:Prefoldin subunit 1 n=1 Tax=Lagenidium giganteum TaxID=4803 RepID=A0AAV2ZAF5_9STRA|nr:TPA: hypothetical protein N0F65_011650 [Lagenidium giganteum]
MTGEQSVTMAKVESELEAWNAKRIAAKLDAQTREVQVALGELESVRPKKVGSCFVSTKHTYLKKANVYFLERRDVIIKTKRNEQKDKEQRRHDVGMQLRDMDAAAH